MVYIYAKGERIAIHQRKYKPGYSTIKDHLCSQHQHYMDRSPDYYMNKARLRSPIFCQYIQQLFAQDRYPEQLYRTCDGLLNLQRKADPLVFDKACTMAIEYSNYSYSFITNILKNGMTEHLETLIEKSLPEHKNIRGAHCFK
jgi:hypothetical protein